MSTSLTAFATTVLALSTMAQASMSEMNVLLEAMGENFRLAVVEYYTASEEAGQTIYFDDRARQSGHHFVPGDPRRGGSYDITWLSDLEDDKVDGVMSAQTQEAISRAMATWDTVTCSTIPLRQVSVNSDWGYVQFLLADDGGFPGCVADITHAGWLRGEFFDTAIGAGASEIVLGATFTFLLIDTGGELTDIDNNGKLDVAFREIYYNNSFAWGINTDSSIDVETVVLHETGHALSQDHFGMLLRTEANGKFHFAPRAVMNAGYSGVQHDLTGTDLAGHCSIWAAWPNNQGPEPATAGKTSLLSWPEKIPNLRYSAPEITNTPVLERLQAELQAWR